MSGYTGTLRDGREIYIPNWPANVQLEHLNLLCKALGTDAVVEIATLNVAATMLAIAEAEDSARMAGLVKHCVFQARIDGSKIDAATLDTLFDNDLFTIVELFTHVVHSQYSSFFVRGLAKAPSPEA
jgi:hypothetical protein